MTLLVFAIGVVNLALGFMAAVSLSEPPPWAGWRVRFPRRGRRDRANSDRSSAEREVPNQHGLEAVPEVGAAASTPTRPSGANESSVATAVLGIEALPAEWL